MPEGSEAVTIRALRADDCERLVRIDARISGRSRRAWYEGKLRRALEDTDLNISLGAELDGLLVGALMGSVHYGEFGLPEPVAILDTVLVDPDYKRRGVARAMLDQLLRNLSALRIRTLRTEVAWDELDLIAFFAKSGFRPAPRLVLERPVDGD
ncbi:MAG: GNAT family N-acetyltransferase [Acidobacteria bacterium]|nr:MAG: GNAT family N-acetyltransferase [Acidobacteriota bacterium]